MGALYIGWRFDNGSICQILVDILLLAIYSKMPHCIGKFRAIHLCLETGGEIAREVSAGMSLRIVIVFNNLIHIRFGALLHIGCQAEQNRRQKIGCCHQLVLLLENLLPNENTFLPGDMTGNASSPHLTNYHFLGG